MRTTRWARAVACAVLAFGGGDQERGIQLLAQGKFAEAAAAFRAALESEGPDAELSYNLALALWRAGQLDEAETAAETAATLSDGALAHLRDGLLGNLRYTAAQEKEAAGDLEGAAALARQARDHLLRGALSEDAPAEIARNLERAEKLIADLEKKIEEQKQQQEEQKDQEQKDDENQDQQDDEQKQDEEKQDEEEKDDRKQDDDQEQNDEQKDEQKEESQQDEQQQDDPQDEQGQPQPEEPSEPKPEEAPQPEPQEDEQPQSQPDEQKAQPPAPGEQQEGRELTPEEKKQLEEKLARFQQQLLELREQQKAQRPKVKKDW